MTHPASSSLRTSSASSLEIAGPLPPLPLALERLTKALAMGTLLEAREAAETLIQTWDGFNAYSDSWRSIPAEALVERSVDLWMALVASLRREELADWMTTRLAPRLAKRLASLEEGTMQALEQIPGPRRASVLIRTAARGRAALDAVLNEAAGSDGDWVAAASSEARQVVMVSLKGLQGVLNGIRAQIKAVTAPEFKEASFSADRLRRLHLLISITFITMLMVRISAVVLGGVVLAQPTDGEGSSGSSVARFALNTTNLAATFTYERIQARRTDALKQHTELSRERVELKKALFRAQDWTTALQTLCLVDRNAHAPRALCPANLQAGFQAIERIQDPARGSQTGPHLDGVPVEGQMIIGQPEMLLGTTQMRQVLLQDQSMSVETLEHNVDEIAGAVDRLMDPLRDAMQGCARTCEGIPTGENATPATLRTIAAILQRHVSVMEERLSTVVELTTTGQELLGRALEGQRSCCGSNRSRLTQLITQLFDYGFAGASWLLGRVEAYAGLDDDRRRQILLATAVIDAINSGTAPLREFFFNRAESYQKSVLRLSQAVASLEGIRPLAEAAQRAFGHICRALEVAGGRRSEELDPARIQEAARVAFEVGQIAIALSERAQDDPVRIALTDRLQQMMGLLEDLVSRAPPPLARQAVGSVSIPVSPSVEAPEETCLTQALAEAALLPKEKVAKTPQRAMPDLSSQLRRAAQLAEYGISSVQETVQSPERSQRVTRSLVVTPTEDEACPTLMRVSDVVIEMEEGATGRSSSRRPASPSSSSGSSARASQLWAMVRRSKRLLAASGFLERGGWRDPVQPDREGWRLASMMQAALVVSASRALSRLQGRSPTLSSSAGRGAAASRVGSAGRSPLSRQSEAHSESGSRSPARQRPWV